MTILKSHYWDFYDEGQCTQASFLLLTESADYSMDDSHKELTDWEHCLSCLYSDKSMQTIGRVSQVNCVGKFFKQMFFNQLTLAYDLCINFIQAHEAADKMLCTVIDSKTFVDQIKQES